MWRNYLTVGVRALAKNRTYAFINIAGLAIGMAACLMILLFVRYELSYDKWIPNSKAIYQVQGWYKSNETGEEKKSQYTSYVAGKALKKDFPQIESEVYGFATTPVFIKDGEASTLDDFLFVDGDFLAMFELPMLRGDRTALNRVNSAVLTRSEAIRLFGSDDVVGRTLPVVSRGITRDLLITGILMDLPKNSHLRLATVARVDFPAFNWDTPAAITCWGCQDGWVWVKLRPGADPETINLGLPAWEKRNIPDEMAAEARYNAGDDQDWKLVNIEDVHLGEAQMSAMTPGNDRRTIVTFVIIALLILGMAVENFTNLATARASQRAREVALRKVLGATRRQLIIQFIGESVLISMVAMLVALSLVELLLPIYAGFLDADIGINYFGADGIIVPVLVLVFLVGVLGGLYPAFVLSRFQPASVLKANKSSAETPGTGRMRNMLVVAQFAVSIGLIICTGIIYAQTVYARTVDPGFDRDQILQVEEFNRYQMIGKDQAIAERARRVPGVEAASLTDIGVATGSNKFTSFMVPGQSRPVTLGAYNVDPYFLDAMGIDLIAGRWFEPNRPLDNMTTSYPPRPEDERALAARGGNIVVNALAAKRLGFAKPADALGKTLRGSVVRNEIGLVPLTIVGVIKDARFGSVREPIQPSAFLYSSTLYTHMVVRFRGDPVKVRAGVEQAWKSVTRDVPFKAKFSDAIMVELYRGEEARAKAFGAFALLAVIVACLGLFGLAAFTAERRTKEIGIRKVLGARTRDIVRLLVWQFSKPVILANLIAWPIAWWVMRDWLNGFDARIGLGPTPFLAAGAIALAIALGTISGHAFKVARANPINALRYE